MKKHYRITKRFIVWVTIVAMAASIFAATGVAFAEDEAPAAQSGAEATAEETPGADDMGDGGTGGPETGEPPQSTGEPAAEPEDEAKEAEEQPPVEEQAAAPSPTEAADTNADEESGVMSAMGEEMQPMAAAGDFNITLTNGGGNPTGNDYSYANGILTIKSATPVTISMNGVSTTTHRIVVTTGAGVTANITLNGVTIDTTTGSPLELSGTGAGANVALAGVNTLKTTLSAGIYAPAGKQLAISGSGTVNATGGEFSAGVGGGNNAGGNITISGGTVTATGVQGGAGIGGGSHGAGGTITINGGTVTATSAPGSTGYAGGAGIGGGNYSAGGNITINGGMVNATGCGAAGVGGGAESVGVGSTINISGGTVTATGVQGGAGIGGGGFGGASGTIKVSGGTVTATNGGYGSADIGVGDGGSLTAPVTITGGSVRAVNGLVSSPQNSGNAALYLTTLTLDGVSSVTAVSASSFASYGLKDVATDAAGKLYFWLPVTAQTPRNVTAGGKTYYGQVAVTTGTNAHTLFPGSELTVTQTAGSGGVSRDAGNNIVINGSGSYTISMASGVTVARNETIIVTSGAAASITLDNVKIEPPAGTSRTVMDLKDAGACTVTLVGTNTLKSNNYAGIFVPQTHALTIKGDGSLEAAGSNAWPGIGRSDNDGNIIIDSGAITARGGGSAAGIGGTNASAGGRITINGGTVNATGGAGGAGIGGGSAPTSAGTSITIYGGTVNATGGENGAGIGGGFRGAVTSINISRGTVTAQGGEGGAGVGGGYQGAVTSIDINSGVVKARGGTNGAGIGTAYRGKIDLIRVYGGNTEATGGFSAAGIGGGFEGESGDITISGGTVTAASGGNGAKDIGQGLSDEIGTITIDGGSVNAATASPQPKNSNDAGVYLNTLTLEGVTADVKLEGGSIGGVLCAGTPNAERGVYGIGGVDATDGKLYFWLPSGTANQAVSALAYEGGTLHTYINTYTRATNNTNTQTLYKNARPPVISTQPAGAAYSLNGNAIALTVAASSPDNGALSYQWYASDTDSTTGGTPVGVNSASYTPPTSSAGTKYYYCVVTNTNNGMSGAKTAATTSGTAEIKVGEGSLSLSLTCADIVYGSALSPILTGNTENGVVTYEYKKQSDPDTAYSPTAPTNAGSYTVRASVAATANYGAATSNATQFSITKATPSINFTVTKVTATNATLTATLTGVSDTDHPTGDVVFSVTDPDVPGLTQLGTVSLANGVAVCNWTDIRPTLYAGPNAEYAGDGNYVAVRGTVGYYTSNKDNQPTLDITGIPATVTYGDVAFQLGITGGSGSGAVTYSVQSGNAVRIDGNTVAIVGAGTAVIEAVKAADDDYNAASATAQVTVQRANPALTLTLDQAVITYGDTPRPTLGGNTGDGAETFDYTVRGASAYTQTVPTNAGDYTVRATVAQTANYNGGTVTADFTIEKAGLELELHCGDVAYGYAPSPRLTGNIGGGAETVEYKARGANDNTYATAVPTDVGEYTVRVSVAATANYNGGGKAADFAITKATPSITMGASPSGGSTVTDDVTLTAELGVSGAGGFPTGSVVFKNGGTVLGTVALTDGRAEYLWQNVPAGAHDLTAEYTGSNSYAAASDEISGYDVSKLEQDALSITGVPAAITYGDGSFTLGTSGGSGTGAVTYSVQSGDAVTVGGSTAAIAKAGTAVIEAVKAADSTYNEASATVTVVVGQAAPVVSANPTVGGANIGEPLAAVALSGLTVYGVDGAALSGTFEWQAPQEIFRSAGAYTAVFTPDDASYAVATFSVQVNVSTTPPAITSVRAVPYGQNGAMLAVEAESEAALGYQWQVKDGAWADVPGGSTAKFDYTGLAANTEYTVRVIVTDANGNSATSNEVTFKTSGYIRRTLTHAGTGISVTGWFTEDAKLTVKKNKLHKAGTCAACDKIRAMYENGELLLLYDISSDGRRGDEVEVTIPVGSEYDGKALTVLHCDNGVLERKTLTVAGGAVTGVFSSLSPYAVVKLADTDLDKNPDTDDTTDTTDSTGTAATTKNGGAATGDESSIWLWLVLMVAAGASIVATAVYRRRKRVNG